MEKMIVHEDDALIVVHKPQGIATQTARIGEPDVVSELRNYRKKRGEDTYIGVVHRLDQPVEGLLVFAKTPAAAAALSRQLNAGGLKKSYIAFVDGMVEEGACGALTDYLIKDASTNLSRVVDSSVRGAKEARLNYVGVKCHAKFSIVAVELLTGRHHQIRVQFSHAGMPLLGDGKYGTERTQILSEQLGIKSTALLADRLKFLHPQNGREQEFAIEYTEAAFCRTMTEHF